MTSCSATLRSAAAARMAAASGCSLDLSRLAPNERTADSSKPAAATTAVTRGFPSVSVPVLSTTRVSTFSNRSSASAFLISTPALAPLPTPTMIDIGVARPSAHGHAMISTDTAATTASPSAGAGAQIIQAANAMTAEAITAGTNQAATTSTRRWMGARLRCASATMCTIRDSMVSAPIFSAVIIERAGTVDRAADHFGTGRSFRPASTRR